MKKPISAASRFGLTVGFIGSLLATLPSRGAISSVSVGDNFFNPQTLTINVNDRVRWSWTGINPHSSSSNTGLWDSTVHGNGWTFTNTFTTAGSFPYHCSVHAFQTGTITVQAANAPPTISLTEPTNNSVFAAPWSGTMRANASDADGSVLKVDFFAGATRLGTISNPPPTVSFAVPGLTAGTYALKAVAMDNRGATNASSVVNISVLTPAPITISAPAQSNGVFSFSYSATPGLSYVVNRASTLGTWSPLSTNVAAGAQVNFTDSGATGAAGFYSVSLLPNP